MARFPPPPPPGSGRVGWFRSGQVGRVGWEKILDIRWRWIGRQVVLSAGRQMVFFMAGRQAGSAAGRAVGVGSAAGRAVRVGSGRLQAEQ